MIQKRKKKDKKNQEISLLNSKLESYYQETVLPKMKEDGCSEEAISEYLAYRELMCDPLTFLLDVFFKEDKTFFDDYSIFKKERGSFDLFPLPEK